MAGDSYRYKEMFPDLDSGLKKLEVQLEKIVGLINQVKTVPNTGAGLKKTNQLYKESAQIQTETLKITKLQKQKIKELNKERQKEFALQRKLKDAKNLELALIQEEIRLERQATKAKAQKRLEQEKGLKSNNKLVNSINKLSTQMLSYIKTMGIMAAAYAGFRVIKESIELFQAQEQAVRDNEAVFGNYSDVIQKYASEIQKVTTVGDEQFIALTTQAKNFGIAITEVNDATTGAIGLAEKFKKAGLSQETALKGIALAYQGNFSQLERYIPALRNAETEAEKMAILQKEMASGFDLAKEAAKTSGGQMQQMKNEIGDMKEEIGRGLIPILSALIAKIRPLVSELTSLFGDIADITSAFKSLNKQSEETNEKFTKYTDVLKKLVNPLKAIWTYNKFIIKAFKEFLMYLGLVEGESVGAKKLTRTLDEELNPAIDELIGSKEEGKGLKGVNKEFTELIETGRSADKMMQDFTSTARQMAEEFEKTEIKFGAEGAGQEAEKSFLDKLFGTDEERQKIQSDYQNLYGNLSTIVTSFLEVTDKRKDKSSKKDRQRMIFQKGLAITNATINTFLAASDVLAKTKGGFLVKALAFAATIALGIANVAKISSQNYKDGTEYVRLNGAPKGVDTIPFFGADGSINMLNEGERIFTDKQNAALGGMSNENVVQAVSYYRNNVGNVRRTSGNNNRNMERILAAQYGYMINETKYSSVTDPKTGKTFIIGHKNGRITEKHKISV